MEKEFDIVYILGTGSIFNNEELRYSLRSVQMFIKGVRNVFVVGEDPGFLSDNVIYIPAKDIYPCDLKNKDRNLWHKLEIACRHPLISEDFLFSADDNLVLKPSTWNDFIPRHTGLATNEYCNVKRLTDPNVNDWTKTRIKTLIRFKPNERYFWHPHMFTQINKSKFLKCCEDSDYKNRNDVIIFSYYYNRCPPPQKIKNFDTEEYQSARELQFKCRHITYQDSAFAYKPFYNQLKTIFQFKSKYEKTDIIETINNNTQKTIASVIIPCYNNESYINECLDSVLNQTTRYPIELICINDGSTDNTLDILKTYESKFKNIKIINFDKNYGLSHARNIAISQAHGKYICLLDSDDKIKDNYFQKIIPLFEVYDLDILFINMQSFFDNSISEEKYKRYKTWYQRKKMPGILSGKKTLQFYYDNNDNNLAACSMVFKTEFLKTINATYIENIYYEDLPFNLYAILQAKRINNITDQIYLRRVHDNSIVTSKKTFKHFKSYIIAIYYIVKYIKQYCDKNDQKLIDNIIKSCLKPHFIFATHLVNLYKREHEIFNDMYKYSDARICLDIFFELSKKDLTKITTYYSILTKDL